MTLLELILELRERLVAAREQDDKDTLQRLWTALGVILEIAYSSKHDGMITTLVYLEGSARDAFMGVGWKGPVPSVEDINEAMSKNRKMNEVNPSL